MGASSPSTDSVRQLASSLLSSGWRLTSSKPKPLQALWAGYGHIFSLSAHSPTSPSEAVPLILKYVQPPRSISTNGTEDQNDEGDLRKVYSYQAEQYFYTILAPRMTASAAGVHLAQCIGSTLDRLTAASCPSSSSTSALAPSKPVPIALLLTDLRSSFPTPGRTPLLRNETYATLDWLARFGGFWWATRRRGGLIKDETLRLPPLQESALMRSDEYATPRSVWRYGGYTYLATRRKEHASLSQSHDSKWARLGAPLSGDDVSSSIAEKVAAFLDSDRNRSIAPYETLLHGDVKPANLFSTASAEGEDAEAECSVAMFDFQYVGVGLGVCDLAKFFTCAVDARLLVTEGGNSKPGRQEMGGGEESLLQRYHHTLLASASLPSSAYPWETFLLHWQVALVDWLRFQAGWGFWGNTSWLEARVEAILNTPGWLDQLG